MPKWTLPEKSCTFIVIGQKRCYDEIPLGLRYMNSNQDNMADDEAIEYKTGPWDADEIKRLVDAWLAGYSIPEIVKLLNRSYHSVSMKAFNRGLPSRRETRKTRPTALDNELLKDDRLQPGYRYLERRFSRAEVAQALAPEQPQTMIQDKCRNCGQPTVFTSPFQRWCQPCRSLMMKIVCD